jgi:D-alanine-D-alanine ligase-like ATP-grasp enzyme
MVKKRVGILRGGEGENYVSSLKEGGKIITHIFENLSDKYKTVDILVDKDGAWHTNGIPSKPAELLHKVDIVWNTAHPSFSAAVKQFNIPVIGVPPFFSAIVNNRGLLEEYAKNLDIDMPRHLILPLFQEDFDGEEKDYALKKAKEVFKKFPAPWIVRSFTPDSDMGVHVAKTMPQLVTAIEDGIKHKKSILIEELILGKIASLHSIFDFRGENIYILPLVSVQDESPSGNFSQNFSLAEKEKLITLAKKLHNQLRPHPYLKSNFVLGPKGRIYLTGILFMPNLRQDSHFCQSCEIVGAKMHHVVEHILERA